MLNVKTLTDTLSRMELPQLQQYAALHKNDPYVVALALSIANQKKQMKAGQAGQMGMQPQPKVVDQQIAGMAQAMPEDMGIGQLPAPNMQSMAEGGIVAFEEGGEVPRYQVGGIPQVGQLSAQQLANLFAIDPMLAEEAELRAGPASARRDAAIYRFIKAAPVPMMVGEVGTMLSTQAARDVAKMTPQQREALYSSPMLSAMSNDAGLAAAIMNVSSPTPPAPKKAETKTSAQNSPAGLNLVGQGFNKTSPVPPPTQNRNALIASKTADIAAQEKQQELQKIDAALQSAPPGQQRSFLENRKQILLSDQTSAPAPAPKSTSPTFDDMYKNRSVRDTPTAVPPRPASPVAKPPSGIQLAAPPSAGAAGSAGAAPISALQAPGISALNTKPMSAAEAAAEAAKLGDDKEVRNQLQDYVNRQKEVGDASLLSFKEGIAGLPEAYKKYEARLQKEEAEAATDKDKAVGMSIFKAGLAMMAGTSQNALENIGKGAMVGAEDYQAALKDFKKAQRERDRAFADIEQARLADQRGDLKTKLELENRAADRNSNAEGKMVDGIAKLFETNKTNARGIYSTGIEQANQNARTQAQIAADIQRQSMSDAAALHRVGIQERGANARTAMQVNALSTDKNEAAIIAHYAKNPMALKALATTEPALAMQIKQKIEASMLQPMSTPTGAVRP